MPDSLWSHCLQHIRLPCPWLSPRVGSNSCPLSQWCYLTILSCFPLPLLSLIFLSIRIFFNELALYIRWPKYWSFSFSISPSNEYSELISFRTDWFDLLAVQATLKSPPAPWFESTNSSGLSHVLSELFTTTHPSWMALHGMAYSFIELQALSPQQDCDSWRGQWYRVWQN